MKSRPCLIVEIEDHNQHVGYGEIWCNFPGDGASYRFNLLNSIYHSSIVGFEFSNPDKLINKVSEKFKTLFVQSGDMGVLLQYQFWPRLCILGSICQESKTTPK